MTSWTFLYQRGESSTDIFVLLQGHLLVVDVDRDSIVAELTPGALFGISGTIDIIEGRNYRPRRQENIYTATHCELLRISQEDMLDLIITYPDMLPPLVKYTREFTELTRGRQLQQVISIVNLFSGGGISPGMTSPTSPTSPAAAAAAAAAPGSRRLLTATDSERQRRSTLALEAGNASNGSERSLVLPTPISGYGGRSVVPTTVNGVGVDSTPAPAPAPARIPSRGLQRVVTHSEVRNKITVT